MKTGWFHLLESPDAVAVAAAKFLSS